MTPDTDMSTQPNPSAKRRPFYLVLLLFFAPLLIAFGVYYGSSWRPTGTTNKGDLVTPVVQLPEVTLATLGGEPAASDALRKVWTLVYVNEGQCDDACRKIMGDLKAVRQMLGKDMTRTAGAALLTGNCCGPEVPSSTDGLLMLRADDAAGQHLLSSFPADHSGHIYIVDPLGNLMMSYQPGSDPRDIYQDMKKLLTLSHIG